MAEKCSTFRPNLAIFGVRPIDPGWLYIVRNGPLFKVGKTVNPARRLLKEAKTWLPDLEIVGVKPFWEISSLERQLHSGLADHWYSREWHRFPDDTYDWLFDDFRGFYDEDRDMNSVDFIYWITGSGMAELIMEQEDRKISLRKWQREAKDG
ncbi:GIY-YIG nuclease family protein [Frankia sp. RB7]|nr:GIY-YIG nuclease family protein [Frankia sp. RB7]